MPFSFNGNTPDTIKFNGNDVLHLVCNGKEVWTKNTAPETWVFNDNLNDTIRDTVSFTKDFTSDDVVFHSIKVVASGQTFTLKYDDITACTINTNTWTSEGYKVIQLNEAALGELKQWLLANAARPTTTT